MYDRPTRFILLHTLAKIPTKNPTSITALEKSNISSLVACSENVANLTLRFPWRQSVARFIIATTIRLTMLSSGPSCTRAAAKFTVGKGHQWPRLRVLAYYHRRQVSSRLCSSSLSCRHYLRVVAVLVNGHHITQVHCSKYLGLYMHRWWAK